MRPNPPAGVRTIYTASFILSPMFTFKLTLESYCSITSPQSDGLESYVTVYQLLISIVDISSYVRHNVNLIKIYRRVVICR